MPRSSRQKSSKHPTPKSSSKSISKSSPKPSPRTSSKTSPEPSPKSSPKSHHALETYSRENLEKSLKIDAKALGIPIGAAEIFIQKTLDAVEKSLDPKKIITERDLTSAISKELKKYHADFAYIYQNRDKIV